MSLRWLIVALFTIISCLSANDSSSLVRVVDLRKFILGNESQQKEVINEVSTALGPQGIGFVLFKNHGISQNVIDNAFKMQRDFFNKSVKYKEKFNKIILNNGSYNEFFGYTGIQKEIMGNTGDYKEVYDTVLDGLLNHYSVGENTSNTTNGFPYALPIKQYSELAIAMRQTTLIMLQIISMALNGPRFFLSNLVDNAQNGVLRFVHYPPTPATPSNTPISLKIKALAAHTDYYPMVIGFQDSNSDHKNGFQGWDKLNKQWISVPYIPGTMLMNIGDAMQRWSNNRLIANFHRINSVNHDRYAMYLFIGPKMNHIIDPTDFMDNSDKTKMYFDAASLHDIIYHRLVALTKDEENKSQPNDIGDHAVHESCN
eukprot:273921_1